jgi:hypothetical protein
MEPPEDLLMRTALKTAALMLLLLLPLACLAGEKKKDKDKPPEQFAALSFTVLRDSSGHPIKNASVVVHWLHKDGTQADDGFQLKTDNDGHASIADIPYGRLRLQVLAHGFQTYGDDIELNQPKHEYVIRLKPPADQVSIYK